MIQRAHLEPQALRYFLGIVARPAHVQECSVARPGGQQEVLQYGAYRQEALAAPVTRDESDALAHRLTRVGKVDFLAREPDGPRVGDGSEKSQQELRLPLSLQAAETQDLAFPQLQAYTLEHCRAEILSLQQNRLLASGISGVLDVALRDAALDHEPYQLFLARLPQVRRADGSPVPEHSRPVGDLEDLLHAVRDEDEGHAPSLPLPDELEEPLDLPPPQTCGGLIQNHDARLAAQRLEDLHDLSVAGREVRYERVGTDGGPQGVLEE